MYFYIYNDTRMLAIHRYAQSHCRNLLVMACRDCAGSVLHPERPGVVGQTLPWSLWQPCTLVVLKKTHGCLEKVPASHNFRHIEVLFQVCSRSNSVFVKQCQSFFVELYR